MKITDKEATVITDYGMNPDFEAVHEEAIQDVMKILGTTPLGARSVLKSLVNKNMFEMFEDEDENDAIRFTEKGLEKLAELMPNVGDDDEEFDDAEADDVPAGEFDLDLEDIEIDLDEDDDEPEPVTMVQKAAKKAKAKAANKKAAQADANASRRSSHADCDHPTSGAEGKTARAKCRKERAAKAKAAEKANA